MRVGEYMTRSLFTVPEKASIKEAVPMIRRHRIRHLLVVNGSRLVGVVSDGDIRRNTPGLLGGINRQDFEQVMLATTVGSIMTKEVMTVTEETPLVEAVRVIVEHKFGCLPVVQGEDLVGIFTEIDALEILLRLV